MKTISVIGYSGSGKTFLIIRAIELLKKRLNINSSVLKNIHEHRIDIEGKDSYKFSISGAQYSITRNKFKENTIFIKRDIEIQDIIDWIEQGPLETDVLFIEGFRNLCFPTILCIKDISEIQSQLNNNVKVISGIVSKNKTKFQQDIDFPIIDINQEFDLFLDIFKII